MRLWAGFGKALDLLSEGLGRVGWFLVLYCMIFGVTDVFLRYALNAPSQWISTTLQAAMVFMACVGGAYALKYDAFVKLDLFYAGRSARTRALLDIITFPLTVLFLSVLIWKGIQAAQMSIRFNQMTPTAVPIPIYPIKTAIPIAAFIVLLVVIKQFVRDVLTLMGRSPEDV